MLEVRNVQAWYGEAQALHDVSFGVRAGEVVTLVGRNGAGKTTLLRSLIGLHRQVRGSIELDGVDMSKAPAHRRARAGMGWVQDDRGVYANLTVEENLLLPPKVSDAAWPLGKVYEAFPVLADRRRAPGTTLSGGEQQMLAVARVLRTGARLLLLDEPSEGLAPVIVARIGEIIRDVKTSGVAVLLIEQNVKFAATVADRHYLLAQGRVVEALDNHEFVEREGELLEHLGM
ncbi:MAG TPA: ABC transporter ATP-binding protein [Nocardioidaceae bacterium]